MESSMVSFDGHGGAVHYIYKNDQLVSVLKNDIDIIQTSFLYNINEYLVQGVSCFAIISAEQYTIAKIHGFRKLMWMVGDHRIYHTGHCKALCITKYHDVVVYDCGRSCIAIADTVSPYRLNPNVRTNTGIVGDTDPPTNIVIDHSTYSILVEFNNHYGIFSMFPRSLTASTRSDTILE